MTDEFKPESVDAGSPSGNAVSDQTAEQPSDDLDPPHLCARCGEVLYIRAPFGRTIDINDVLGVLMTAGPYALSASPWYCLRCGEIPTAEVSSKAIRHRSRLAWISNAIYVGITVGWLILAKYLKGLF